mgnify:CR=1 FL=1
MTCHKHQLTDKRGVESERNTLLQQMHFFDMKSANRSHFGHFTTCYSSFEDLFLFSLYCRMNKRFLASVTSKAAEVNLTMTLLIMSRGYMQSFNILWITECNFWTHSSAFIFKPSLFLNLTVIKKVRCILTHFLDSTWNELYFWVLLECTNIWPKRTHCFEYKPICLFKY